MSFSPLELDHLSPEEPLLLGISGGLDSVVLLDYYAHLWTERTLYICHVHHGLRGKEADRDQAFVQSLACEKYHLPFFSRKGDVFALARERKESVELAARLFRYQCFQQWSKELGASHVLLAHHAQDLVETALFNLMRGSVGLKGIRPYAFHHDLHLHRPFLSLSKEDLRSYAEEKGLCWQEDSTNNELCATRNQIRHQILPLLEKLAGERLQPKIRQACFLQQETKLALQEALDKLELYDPQGRLFLPKVKACAPPLQKEILLSFLKKEKVPNLSHALLERALSLLDPSPQAPAKVSLPGGHWLRRKEQRLFVQRGSQGKKD